MCSMTTPQSFRRRSPLYFACINSGEGEGRCLQCAQWFDGTRPSTRCSGRLAERTRAWWLLALTKRTRARYGGSPQNEPRYALSTRDHLKVAIGCASHADCGFHELNGKEKRARC